MAETLEQIRSEIERLERQASLLRARELIVQHRLTPSELFGSLVSNGSTGDNGSAPQRRRTARKRSNGAPKFRDDAGHTWSGHGRQPQWYRDAIAAGKKPEDLRVA